MLNLSEAGGRKLEKRGYESRARHTKRYNTSISYQCMKVRIDIPEYIHRELNLLSSWLM